MAVCYVHKAFTNFFQTIPCKTAPVAHRVGGNALRNIIPFAVTSNITRYIPI